VVLRIIPPRTFEFPRSSLNLKQDDPMLRNVFRVSLLVLAVIMHRMWVDGTEFCWTREQAAAAA